MRLYYQPFIIFFKKLFVLYCLFPVAPSFSQDSSSTIVPGILPDTINKSSAHSTKKLWLTGAATTVVYSGSLVVLNKVWYANYPRGAFHTFNDNKEWLQTDKIGHAWSVYNLTGANTALWQWAGLNRKQAALVGGLSSIAYLTTIEYLDGRSEKWGWSWGDMTANLAGAGLFMAQDLAWKEQRVQFKFSFHTKKYDELSLERRADDLFGKSWQERMLKDYNAQTYWLSANLKSFFKNPSIPSWLNVSFGYGADGMFGGFENIWENESGGTVTRYDIPRKRQFYLAPDIDFTKIKTNKKWLKTTFQLLNAFKCPAPALMMDSKGKVKGYFIYF